MNSIFLGEPSQYIKNWFIQTFPYWPAYTTLEFVNGTTQTKEIEGTATWQNIGVKISYSESDYTLKSCQLGKNVTEISSDAFYNCHSLTSINIPNSVTSIGGNAFQGCSSLTSITIPNPVTSIGDWTFWNCYSLTSVNIPSSITTIGRSVFGNCTSLSSITIPNSVTSIGEYVFGYCDSLTSIIFEGKAMSDITSMANYPWEIPNTSAIIPGIS